MCWLVFPLVVARMTSYHFDMCAHLFHSTAHTLLCNLWFGGNFSTALFLEKKMILWKMHFDDNKPDDCVSVPDVYSFVICLVMGRCIVLRQLAETEALHVFSQWKHTLNRNVSLRFHTRWVEVQHARFLCNSITHLCGLRKVIWHNIVHCFTFFSAMARNCTCWYLLILVN